MVFRPQHQHHQRRKQGVDAKHFPTIVSKKEQESTKKLQPENLARRRTSNTISMHPVA